ncbi:MAG: pseudouridylate synthase [Bacteroidales bacterium]|nr:pseudouridylate synthase [Bacteroidales bacterium]
MSEIGNRKSEVEQSEIGSRKSEIGQSEINILDLLPQRQPFIMIDSLLHFDMVLTVTGMKIAEDNMFVENGVLTESGVIENIAQTCAARMGYINKYLCADKVKIGFIGSIKDLVIEELPRVGDELKTTVEVVSEIFAITLVNAKVEIGDKVIASCEMKISITDIDG